MNITLDSSVSAIDFNGTDIAEVRFNGASVWKRPTPHIYGVEWAGTSSPICTRTDESASFADPVPWIGSGSISHSSPFDSLMPWSGMVKETINGDVFVKIPKYWFKVTTSGTKRKIQIADRAVSGFSVSPAHQDRGDGKGERDYIYVGRYHASRGYKSVSGVKPLASITIGDARSGCTGRGTGYYQFDMMALITIWYLYLVEFAHWNSQLKIGYGCGNGSAAENTGATDTMSYHTGTMSNSRETYAVGVQYRWIEDLWANVYDLIDGVYFSSANVYAFKNPADYSDSGGVLVGTRPKAYGLIKSWKYSTVSGYEWFVFPSSVISTDIDYATYCCDALGYNSSSTRFAAGSNYNNQHLAAGIFRLNGTVKETTTNAALGTRLMYLP